MWDYCITVHVKWRQWWQKNRFYSCTVRRPRNRTSATTAAIFQTISLMCTQNLCWLKTNLNLVENFSMYEKYAFCFESEFNEVKGFPSSTKLSLILAFVLVFWEDTFQNCIFNFILYPQYYYFHGWYKNVYSRLTYTTKLKLCNSRCTHVTSTHVGCWQDMRVTGCFFRILWLSIICNMITVYNISFNLMLYLLRTFCVLMFPEAQKSTKNMTTSCLSTFQAKRFTRTETINQSHVPHKHVGTHQVSQTK